MSYCRRGWDGSDIYMFEHVDGFVECSGCPLQDEWIVELHSLELALAHVAKHREAGHNVPEGLEESIQAENPWQGKEPPILSQVPCPDCGGLMWNIQPRCHRVGCPSFDPPFESDDYCVACDDYHDPDEGPCAVIVVGDDSD